MSLLELLKSLAGIEHWDFADRRSTLRVPCRIDGVMDDNGQIVEVEIEDIGLRGLRLLVLGEVRKGAVVHISGRDKPGNPFSCQIEWKREHPRGFVTGVSFKDSAEVLGQSWLLAEVKAIGDEAVETKQRRGGVRVICNTKAQLTVEKEKLEVNMIDLGIGGALVEGEELKFQAGDTLRLEFGPVEDMVAVVVNCSVVTVHERDVPRYGIGFESFYDGGVTDIERYLTHFSDLQSEG